MGPIKPGDRFYRVKPIGRAQTSRDWVKVLKVGRRWVYFVRDSYDGDKTVDEYTDRFDKETLLISRGPGWKNSFTDEGRVYRSEEDYLWETRDERLWEELCQHIERVRYQKPDNVNDVAIFKAADALGIKLERG